MIFVPHLVIFATIFLALQTGTLGSDADGNVDKFGGNKILDLFGKKASALLNLFGKKTKSQNRESNDKIEIIGDGRIPEPDLVSAKVDIEDGRFALAIEKLLNVLDKFPENIEASNLIGACFLAQNRPDLAEGFLFTAVRLSNWTDFIAVANLAECVRVNKDYLLAEKIALKGLQMSGNADPTGTFSFVLGVVQVSKENYTAAADWFLAAAIQQPSNIDAWIQASTIEFPPSAFDVRMAENVLMEALRLNPTSALLTFQLGFLFHKTSRVNEAILLYQRALEMDASMSDALSGLATALHAVGRVDDALEVYAEAERAQPTNIVLLSNYAMLLSAMKKSNESLVRIRKAKAIDGDHPEVLRAEAVYGNSLPFAFEL